MLKPGKSHTNNLQVFLKSWKRRHWRSILEQCFVTGWMVYPRVNEIFATVNARGEMNEIYVPNFSYPLVTRICLVFFYPKHINNRE